MENGKELNDRADDDVLMSVCGEIEPGRREAVERSIAADPARAAEAARFRAAMSALRQGDPRVSDDFNDRLRDRLIRSSFQAPVRRPGRTGLARWTGVAAALVVGLILGSLFFAPSGGVRDPSVAWADVVRAMDRVKHFHILTFADEPRNANSPKMYRIDLYHERPDRWRAHGLGFVQFGAAGERMFSLEERKFVDPRAARVRLIPPEFVEKFAAEGLLPGILHSLFRGKTPPGEPVKSDEVSAGEGIEVFDYANAPAEQWARIWVLKQSRLPVRMHIYQPGSNDFMLVVFDYSDPQPAEFFDSAGFEKAVREKGIVDPQQIMGVGTRPVGGNKPRESGQIHDALGGYAVPKIKRVLANDRGEVVLVTNVLQNKSPAGHSLLDEGYDNVRDNWGNRYVMAGAQWGIREKEEGEWFFTPVPPFKTMPGRRVLSLDYKVRMSRSGRGIEDLVLAGQTAVVPEQVAETWPPGFTPSITESVVLQHLRSAGTLAEQIQAVEKRLAAFPDDANALTWKVDLLIRHDRAAAGWALFETKLKDRFIGPDPYVLTSPYPTGELLARYMFKIAGDGRMDDARRVIARLNEIRATVKEMVAKDKRAPRALELARHVKYLFDEANSPLAPAVKIPAAVEAFAGAPRPRVTRVAAARDGTVFYELELPPAPEPSRSMNPNAGGIDPMTFWFGAMYPDATARGRMQMVKDGKGVVWTVASNPGEKIEVSGKAVVARRPHNSEYQVLGDWTASAVVPPPAFDTRDELLSAQTPGANWSKAMFPAPGAGGPDTLHYQGWQAFEAGRFGEAIELFRRTQSIPDAEWPEHYRHPANGNLLADTRRRLRLAVAKSLAMQGKLDEAEGAIAEVEKAAPPFKVDDDEAVAVHTEIRSARLASVKYLMKSGRLNDAATLMDSLEVGRIDLSNVPDRYVVSKRAGGVHNWSIYSRHRDAWREFDTLRWDLADAMRAVK